MKKSNKILVGLLAFVLVCVIGYALFSENITVTGTATAQGQFKFESTCDVITSDIISFGDDNTTKTVQKSTGTGTCTIENGVIKTTSTLSKPTDVVNFHVQILNVDSNEVWAKLKNITSPNNITTTGQTGDKVYGDFSTGLAAYYTVYGKNISDSKYCANTTTYMGDSAVNSANIIVKNDCILHMIITHQWTDMDDLGMEQPVIPSGGATLNYDISLQFEQYIQ